MIFYRIEGISLTFIEQIAANAGYAGENKGPLKQNSNYFGPFLVFSIIPLQKQGGKNKSYW
jgi:hypothetical protein